MEVLFAQGVTVFANEAGAVAARSLLVGGVDVHIAHGEVEDCIVDALVCREAMDKLTSCAKYLK